MTDLKNLECPCGKPVTGIEAELLPDTPKDGWACWKSGKRFRFTHEPAINIPFVVPNFEFGAEKFPKCVVNEL